MFNGIVYIKAQKYVILEALVNVFTTDKTSHTLPINCEIYINIPTTLKLLSINIVGNDIYDIIMVCI